MDSQDTSLSFDTCFPDLESENLGKLVQLWTSFQCPNLEGNSDTPGLKTTYQETLAAQPEVDTAGAIPDEFLEFLQESQAQEERPCRNVLPPPQIQGPAFSTKDKLPCEAAVPESLPGPMPGAGEEVEEKASGPVKPKKREWERFSPYQRQVLMERFKVNRNLTTKVVEDLSSQLGLSPKEIKNWFQKERKKFKKGFNSEDFLVLPDGCLEFLQERQAQEQRPCGNVLPHPEIQGPTLSTTEKLPSESAVPDQLPPPKTVAREEVEEAASGPVKTKKREWVRFSPYQRQVLMERFKVNRNITTKDVEDLSSQLGLSPKQVRNWFRNERKNFKLWFPHLLNGEQGADSKSVQKMNEGWSVKSGVGARLQFLLEK